MLSERLLYNICCARQMSIDITSCGRGSLSATQKRTSDITLMMCVHPFVEDKMLEKQRSTPHIPISNMTDRQSDGGDGGWRAWGRHRVIWKKCF